MPKVKEMTRTEKAKIQAEKIPTSVICDFSASLIPAINAYFEQPGVKEEYESWLTEYRKRLHRKEVNHNE